MRLSGFFVPLTAFVLLSADTPGEEEKKSAYSEDVDPRLGRLLDSVEGVKGQYQACRQLRQQSSAPQNFKMGDCLWNGGPGIPPLDAKAREEVIKKLQVGEEDSGLVSRYEGVALANVRPGEDKVMRRLQDYLAERLKEVLFDEKQEGARVVRDHKIWHDLYTSQVGRNVLHATSTFCLMNQARPVYLQGETCQQSSQLWFDYRPDDEEVRRQNIEKLGQEAPQNSSRGFVHFSQCIASLAPLCAKEGLYAANSNAYAEKGSGQQCRYKLNRKVSQQTFDQACVVVDYLKASKQMLISLQGVEKGWQRLRGERGQLQVASQQRSNVEGGLVNKVINVPSGQIAEGKVESSEDDSTWQEVADEHAEELQKCAGNAEDETCAAHLLEGEENFKVLDEYSLRRYAMNAKINQDLSDDSDHQNLKAMLLESGTSEERVEEILKGDEAQIVALKARIARRAQRERDALTQAMREKFNRRTLFGADEAAQKFAALESEARRQPSHYAQAVHYSNVVAAFVSLREGDKKVGQNTAALAAELEQSVFDTSRRPAGGASGQTSDQTSDAYFKNLKKVGQNIVAEGEGQANGGDQQFGQISIETINTLLGYLPRAD